MVSRIVHLRRPRTSPPSLTTLPSSWKGVNIENGDGKYDKPEHEAKDDASYDPAHGGQGESTGLGAGYLQGVEVFTGEEELALTILSLVMVIVPPELSLPSVLGCLHHLLLDKGHAAHV